jgi:hypothetical protein
LPEIRELYNWANIHKIEFFYRIENAQSNKGRRKKVGELVITNYKVKKVQDVSLTKWVPDVTFPDRLTIKQQKIENNIQSPFRYPGSKGRAVKLIKPFF